MLSEKAWQKPLKADLSLKFYLNLLYTVLKYEFSEQINALNSNET